MHVADTLLATTDTIYHLQMQPWGDNANLVDPVGAVLKTSHLNYHLPHCGADGITHVLGYSRVLYENIFPFIDLHFYSGGFGQKMAIVCRPGADLNDLLLHFTGQDSLNMDLWGNLKFYHNGRYFVLPHAVAYQVNPDETTIPVSWSATYDADGDAGLVSFQWSTYDPTRPLVFLVGPPPALGGGQPNTPGVCWSTYLGGDGGDRIYASDTDEAGNYYVGGFTYSQAINFPITPGVVTYAASPMALVTKFGPGYEDLWSTFYGGSEFVGSFAHQWVRGLAVRPGSDPNIVIGGRSATSNLWCLDLGGGSYYDEVGPNGGGFLAELNHTGQIIWSTYFGTGSLSVLNVDVHPQGEIAVCGDTNGPLPPEQDSPPAVADHWNYAGNGDGWIALLKSSRRTYWTTYLGGGQYDFLKSARFGETKVVFTGVSSSSNFPVLNGGSNAHNEPHAGRQDVTVSEFSLEGELRWSTYFGGTGGDQPGYQGLAVRAVGLGAEDVVIVGITSSSDLPFEPGAGWNNPDFLPFTGLSGFIARFSGLDRSLTWATYVNGGLNNTGETMLEAVALDRADRIFVGGYTLSTAFPYQDAYGLYSTSTEYGAWDGVILGFDAGQELRWATRFGGEEGGSQGERIETLCTYSDERLFAAGVTYTVFGPQTFFPFTDPVGDDDFFDDVFYPEWDAFLASFCTEGLLTTVADRQDLSGLNVTQIAPGMFQLAGLPLGTHLLRVIDPAGRVVIDRSINTTQHALIDLTPYAGGAYVAHVAGIGAVVVHNRP